MSSEKKTKQQAFEDAFLGLYRQGRRSLSSGDGSHALCMLRSPDGCKCAVGWLLPDREYSPVMDHSDGIFFAESAVMDHYEVSRGFLVDLRRELHDGILADAYNFRRVLLERARELAEEQNLKMPPIPSTAELERNQQ